MWRVLPGADQRCALDLKESRFDRTGSAKSPQEACQSMNERKLDRCSRIDASDEHPLERLVIPNILEVLSDCFVGEPITPSAAARSAALVWRLDIGDVRDIGLDISVACPHRHRQI